MDEPLANAIKEYFSLCKLIGGAKDPWCAAFMYWCIIESKYKGPASSPASAFSWREIVGKMVKYINQREIME